MDLVGTICKSLIGLRELKEKTEGNEYLITAIETDLQNCLDAAEELTSLLALPTKREDDI